MIFKNPPRTIIRANRRGEIEYYTPVGFKTERKMENEKLSPTIFPAHQVKYSFRKILKTVPRVFHPNYLIL